MKTLFAAILLLVAAPLPAFAHSGRTDANGCHTNRKTGEYHCHGGGSAPRTSLSVGAVPAPTPPAEAPVIRFSTQEEIRAAAERQELTRRLAQPHPERPVERLEFTSGAKGLPDGITVVRPSVAQLVELAQILLRAQGLEITDPNGQLGYSTILAIRRFQSLHHINVDGRLSPALLLDLAKAIPPACPEARP